MMTLGEVLDAGAHVVFIVENPESDKAVNHSVWELARFINRNGSIRAWIVTLREFIAMPSSVKRNSVVVFNGLTVTTRPLFGPALYLSRLAKGRAFFWHETSWNFWAIRNARPIFTRLSNLLISISFQKNAHWVVTRDSVHLVAYIYRQPLDSFSLLSEVWTPQKRVSKRSGDGDSIKIVGAGLTNRRKGFDRWKRLVSNLNEKVPGKFSFTWYSLSSSMPASGFSLRASGNLVRDLAKHDLFILTSRDDPDPLVLHEAKAAGLPFLVFETTGPGGRENSRAIVQTEKELEEALLGLREGRLASASRRVQSDGLTPETFLTKARLYETNHFAEKDLPGGGIRANLLIGVLRLVRVPKG